MRKSLVFMLGLILLSSSVLAIEWDNYYTYDNHTRTATFKNGLTFGSEIARIRLNSDLQQRVQPGYSPIFEIEVWGRVKYSDFVRGIYVHNVTNGYGQVNRNIDLKYLNGFETVYRDVYGCTDSVVLGNGTKQCNSYGVIGQTEHQKALWDDLNPADLNKNEHLIIRGYTDVKPFERMEWFIDFFGAGKDTGHGSKGVKEWAEWISDLNTSLRSYYKLDNNDIADKFGNSSFDLTNSGTVNGTGIIISGRQFDGNNDVLTGISDEVTGGQARSFNLWVYSTDTSNFRDFLTYGTASASQLFHWRQNNDGNIFFQFQGGNVVGNTTLNQDEWAMVTFTFDGTNRVRLYLNSSLIADSTSFGGMNTGLTNDFSFGSYLSTAEYWQGNMDEMAVWSRALNQSEIDLLWNSGAGLPLGYQAPVDAPTITFNSPADTNYTTSPQTIVFNFTAYDPVNLTNVRLYINGSLYDQNASGINNTDYIFSATLSDGTYEVFGQAVNDDPLTTNTANRTFIIDSTQPSITLSFNESVRDYITNDTSLQLNYTVTDNNRDDCFYNYQGSNNIVNCNTNTTSFNYAYNYNTINFTANDTLGNINSDQVYVSAKARHVDEWNPSSVVEGSGQTFYITFDINSTYDVDSASLVYNGTEYTGTFNIAGSKYNISYDLNIPGVVDNSNASYYWSVTLSDSTQINTTAQNVTVNNLNIGSCSLYNYTLFNISLFEERNKNALNGNINVDIDIFTSDRSNNVIQYSNNFSSVSTATICLENDLGSSVFSMDVIMQYESTGFATELYHYYNYTLNNDSLPQVVDLYDLNSSHATEFLITYKDENFLAVDKALINIQRKYVEDGVFRTVELPLTDRYGQTTASFDTEKGIYTIVVTKNNQILGTFSDITVICQDALLGDCDLNLNSLASTSSFDDWNDYDGVSFQTSFDPDTRTIEKTFTSTDGSVKRVTLTSYKSDAYLKTLVCNDSLNSASGTLSCTIPSSFGNISVTSYTYVQNNLVNTESYRIDVNPFDLFGYDAYVMVILLLLTLPFMFVSSGIGVIVSSIAGLVMAGMLNLFTAGSMFGAVSSIIWLVIAGGIIIWKISQRS